MRDLGRYLWLVIKRCFYRMFLLADGLGLALLLLSKSQPNVPIEISLGVFGLIFIMSTFTVWRDAVAERDKLRKRLSKIKNDTPKYTVDTGAIEKFSIAKLIDQTTDELEAVQAKLKPRQNIETSSSLDSLGAAYKTLSQFTINLPRFIGGETLADKEERLAQHLEKLVAFEDRLKKTYRIPLFFEATRADGNVEFQVEVSPESELFVEDDYVEDNLPKTYAPSRYGMVPMAGLNHIPAGGFANRLYPYSHAEDGIGYSKLNKINASRKYRVFDEDFYVETDSDSIELKITIHSEKINEPQIIPVKLDLNGITTNEVSYAEEDE